MTIYDVWFTAVMGTDCPNRQLIADCGKTTQEIYENRFYLDKSVFTSTQTEKRTKTELDDVYKAYKQYSAYGVKCTTYADADFPQCLTGFAHRPLVLYYKGNLSLLDSEYTVGIVGSRQCNGEGEQAAKLIAGDIAQLGGVVVSGLAQGVDVTSQRACVDAGGKTVAFLGTPVNKYFPAINQDFQQFLEKDNLIVSEYIPEPRSYSSYFVSRNRLIAAAGKRLCVIQARTKSGSLHTVRQAKEFEKPVFAVPGSIFRDNYSGSNRLLYDGSAMATSSGRQILQYMGMQFTAVKKSSRPAFDTSSLSLNAQRVYKALDGAMFSAAVIKATGLGAAAVKAALTELEMEEAVIKTENGEYIRKN